MSPITTLFFDIGGVCLSNGWDHEQRQALAQQFGFDYPAFDSRHRQVTDSLERGQLTLEEALDIAKGVAAALDYAQSSVTAQIQFQTTTRASAPAPTAACPDALRSARPSCRGSRGCRLA